MKRTIGGILLAFVFTLLIGATCVAYGWKYGLAIWGIAFVIALIICIAMFLIEEGK